MDDVIKEFMLSILDQHIDQQTDEVCRTTLAEAAAHEFGENDLTIPEVYFELAHEVADQN